MKTETTVYAVCCLFVLGCSTPDPGSESMPPPGGGQTSTGGSGNATGGGSGGAPATAGSGGAVVSGGSGGTPVGTGGESTGGTPGGGSPSGGSPSGGSGGIDPGDTPPPRPLNITAAPEEHVHNVGGRPAAVDNRAPIMMGKLIIDLGVDSGGIYQFGLKRGFHVYGADIEHCNLTYDDLAENGNCRLDTLDGMGRSTQFPLTPETAVLGVLADHLAQLHADFPEEDWGYFLNADGSVRLSDVGVTGYSHGAQSCARWARAYRLYRAVSRSGPRDNECGTGTAAGDFDAANPPWQNNAYAPNPNGGAICDRISDWLLETSMTPSERLFGFVGKQDGQYGDIMLSMEIMQYIGEPVNISTATAPYGGSHRFYADDGHGGYDGEEYWPALQIAWGVPQENMDYAAGL